MVGLRTKIQEDCIRGIRQTDCRKVREWVDRQKELRKASLEPDEPRHRHKGEYYRELVKLSQGEWLRKVNVCRRSKRWWKKEWKELRKVIKEVKAKCWTEWLEKGEDVWQVVRVAQNPFNLKEGLVAVEMEASVLI